MSFTASRMRGRPAFVLARKTSANTPLSNLRLSSTSPSNRYDHEAVVHRVAALKLGLNTVEELCAASEESLTCDGRLSRDDLLGLADLLRRNEIEPPAHWSVSRDDLVAFLKRRGWKVPPEWIET